MYLVDTRKDLVGNKIAVLIVVLAVLEAALLGISLSPVNEQIGQEHAVKQRNDTILQRTGQQTPRPSSRQLKEVLKMSGNAPEARRQEEGLLGAGLTGLAIDDLILGRDVLGIASPHLALATGGTEDVALPIGKVVENDAGHTEHEQSKGGHERQARGMLNEETGVQSVNGGDPNEAAPLNLETGPIHNDIDRTHVSHLPEEEFEQIKVLRQCREHEAVVHGVVIESVRSVAEGQTGKLPVGHGEAAVDETLQVQTVGQSWAWQAGVQLGAPKIVLGKRSRTAAILGRREVQTLVREEAAEQQTKQVQKGDAASEGVVDDAKVVPPQRSEVGPGPEQGRVDQTVEDGIVLVFGDVSREGFGSGFDLSGEEFQQEGHGPEAQDELDGFGVGRYGQTSDKDRADATEGIGQEALDHATEGCRGHSGIVGFHFGRGQVRQQERKEGSRQNQRKEVRVGLNAGLDVVGAFVVLVGGGGIGPLLRTGGSVVLIPLGLDG